MRLSRNIVNGLCALLLGGGLATYQMAPQWRAWWGLMDDAEFLGWAPRGQSLPVRQYVATLATTEVGRIGTTTRFRPIYYTLRVAERVLWPASAAWYYAARTGMFALGLSLCAWALFVALGRVVGAGIFAIIATEWFWRDIWAHGGPAEQYAMVGTSMLAVAGAFAWTDARMTHVRSIAWLAAAGTVLAMGSKENFLILAVPCAIVLLRMAAVPEHRRTAVALLVVVVACAMAIVAAIIPGLRLAGNDVYGNQVGPNARLAWLGSGTGVLLLAIIVAVGVLPFVSWRVLPHTRRTVEARRRHAVMARAMYVQVGLLLLLFMSQLTYYAPKWPTFGGRYDFPGMLVLPLAFASFAVFLLRWLELAGAGARALRRVGMATSLVAIAVASRHGAFPVRDAAEVNARHTQELHAVLSGVVERAHRMGPKTPIIVEWETGSEQEPATSMLRLLYEAGSDGPFFLRAAAGAPSRGPLGEFARTGTLGRGWRDVTLQPLHSLDAMLEASGGAAMVVMLDGYAIPRIRQVNGL